MSALTKRIILFLVLNFAALALGGLATSSAVSGDWYLGLNKAPWTPPGWVFGASWTLIMICFALFMALLYPKSLNKKNLIILYSVQWILNVIWNPIFFYYHGVELGMFVIIGLTCLVAFFLFRYASLMKSKSVLVLPYFIWLVIATSLNAYILFNN